jgi:hypothetical protein
VTLKHSGEVYALDLSGAQYGYYDPVIPFEDYVQERARAIVVPHYPYFGGTKDGLLGRCNEAGSIGSSLRVQRLAYPFLKFELTNWEKEGKTTVQELLAYSKDRFEREKNQLLRRIGDVLDSVVENLREKHLHFKARYEAGENMEAYRLPDSAA